VTSATNNSKEQLQLRQSGRVIATGFESGNGFTVLKGSHARIQETPSLPDSYVHLRDSLHTQGLLVQSSETPWTGYWELTQNHEFGSYSAAASTFLGRNANGKTEWQATEPTKSIPNIATSPTSRHEAESAHENQLVLERHKRPIAHAGIQKDGNILVLSGSKMRKSETASLASGYRNLRATLLDKGILTADPKNDEYLILTLPYAFSSLSAAASTLLGAETNGRTAWQSAQPSRTTNHKISSPTGKDTSYHAHGFALLITCLVESKTFLALSNSKKWKAAPIKISADGAPPRLLNSVKNIVDRAGHYPFSVQNWLWPSDSDSSPNACRRFSTTLPPHYNLYPDTGRDSPIVECIEALLDPPTENSPLNANERRTPVVFILHLNFHADEPTDEDIRSLGESIYSDDDRREQFAHHLKKSVLSEVIFPPGANLDIYPVILRPLKPEQTTETALPDEKSRSLSWASLDSGPQPEETTADPAHSSRTSSATIPTHGSGIDPEILWNGLTDCAYVRRSATVVVAEGDANGYAAATDSIYADALALAWLENLTLREFVFEVREASERMLSVVGAIHGSADDQKPENMLSEQLESLQRDYIENSTKYGKLSALLRYRVADVYSNLSARLLNDALREDISSELNQLAELAETYRSRIETRKRWLDDLDRQNRRLAKEKEKEKEQSRAHRQETILGFLFGVVGFAGLYDPLMAALQKSGAAQVVGTILSLLIIVSVIAILIILRRSKRELPTHEPALNTETERSTH
jgi:hypothetical protein